MEGLLYAYIALGAVGALTAALLLYTTRGPLQTAVFSFAVALSAVTVFLGFTGQPVNFVWQRTLFAVIGVGAAAAAVLYVARPDHRKTAKYILSAALVLGLLALFVL